MEIKRNDATHNRPLGDRVIDASYVYTDIPAFIQQLKQEDTWRKNDRNGITVFKAHGLTIVLTVLHQGAAIPDNSIEGFVTIQAIEGKLRIITVDGDIELTEKHLITLHPKQIHSIEAITEGAFLLTNYNN